MARIDPIDDDSPGVDAELINAVKARRGGRLLNLDRQLLHSPPLARGWNQYLGAVLLTAVRAAERHPVLASCPEGGVE